MIYIINKENNTITTDSWIEYIPSTIRVYLDDVYIGEYQNESSKNEYIVIAIPKEDIVNVENQEYKLKLINGDTLGMIKIELAVVLSNATTESISVVNNKKNKFYE
jgi:hypothetical protein